MLSLINRISKFSFRVILKLLPISAFPVINRICLRLMGIKIGKDAIIYSSVQVLGSVKVQIGDSTFIGHETLIMGGPSKIKIGRNCDISSRVNLITGSHEIGQFDRRAGKGVSNNITIEDGVWIGFGCTVLGGVTIGKGSIIGANSLVNKNIPANSIYGGTPAKEIRPIE